MIPESFMPALRNGVAGFLIAITSIVTPLTAVFNEPRSSPIRETPASGDHIKISFQPVQRRIGTVHWAAHCFDDKADALHQCAKNHGC